MPAALWGDRRRQANASIRGTTYQAWWSIDGWLRIKSAEEVVFVEGAEDYDVVTEESGTTVQVRLNTDPISLGNSKAQDAIQHYWDLVAREPDRQIQFHYLTSSSVAVERDADFDGMPGIEAWRAAQTSNEAARKVAEYLALKLHAGSLRAFLETASPAEIQDRLFKRFSWLTDQGDIDAVKRSVDDRIASILVSQGRPVFLVPLVRKFLESRFWEVVIQRDVEQRRLDFLELHSQITAATSTTFVVPAERVAEFLSTGGRADRLLDLLLQAVPPPPSPLLPRPGLLAEVEQVVRARNAALLVGTVYKGKSTVAQIAAGALEPRAWWVDAAGRTGDQLQLMFNALAERLDGPDVPSLIIIDDLDLSQSVYQRYRVPLEAFLHRAHSAARSVILTARGSLEARPLWPSLPGVRNVDVSELGGEEIKTLCEEFGCPPDASSAWAAVVEVTTQGHPALVQVRLGEIRSRGWPPIGPRDLTGPSEAVRTVKQVTRELLAGTVSASMAEFVYTLSQAAIPLARETVIELANASAISRNPGDEVDRLVGTWIERLGDRRLRVTALLKGVAAEAWSPEQQQAGHVRIRDAIVARGTIDPAEAAALIFHGFLARAESRLANDAMRLQLIDGEAKKLVDRHLLWLPLVALEPGARLAPSAFTSSAVRSLQFRVAVTLESELLARIADRWQDDVAQIDVPEARLTAKALMLLQLSTADTHLLPLATRLQAISDLREFQSQVLPRELQQVTAELADRIIGLSADIIGKGSTATPTQVLLVMAGRFVRGLSAISQLGVWLQNSSPEVRQEFDQIIEWPVVQQIGAFVHSAWAAVHQTNTDWSPWFQEIDRQVAFASGYAMHAYGRELIKAKSIILTEHESRAEDGLEVLRAGAAIFGSSPVLLEQEANVRFQRKDDAQVLELWRKISADSAVKDRLDPFAFRRIAISAARSGDPALAAEIFHDAAGASLSFDMDIVRFGLLVDEALCWCVAGQQRNAASALWDAVSTLPPAARVEGDLRWEAVQRVAAEVCRAIEHSSTGRPAASKVEIGAGSSPSTEMKEAGSGQELRTDLLRGQIANVMASFGLRDQAILDTVRQLSESGRPLVRWTAAQAELAVALHSSHVAQLPDLLENLHRATLDLKREFAREGDAGGLEQWRGFFVAALACSDDVSSDIQSWKRYAEAHEDTCSAQFINLVGRAEGLAHQRREALWSTAQDVACDPLLRCAAARILLERVDELTPQQILWIQVLITSGTVFDSSRALQQVFNRAVGKAFLKSWRYVVDHSAFQLHRPREIRAFLEQAADNGAEAMPSLARVFQMISMATGAPRPDLGEIF